MSRTALQLIQTASKRLGDLILSTPTSAGTTTTLIDSALKQYMQTLTQANLWVYGTSTADLTNRGEQRRASAFTKATNTLSFEVAWPEAIDGLTGVYEIHPRYKRSLILEWLNDAIGQLGIYWFREARDNSIETEDLTLVYNLPNTGYWTQIHDIQIELNPSENITGFPYVSAKPWNWNAYPYTDRFGNRFWQVQFGLQPPPGRLLRIFGEAYYPDLDCDTDVLALSGQYERPALGWVFDWVAYRAMEHNSLIAHTTDVDKSRQRMYDSLNRAKDKLTSMLQPTHQGGQIGLPGRGTGLFDGWRSNDPNYFNAIGGVPH